MLGAKRGGEGSSQFYSGRAAGAAAGSAVLPEGQARAGDCRQRGEGRRHPRPHAGPSRRQGRPDKLVREET